jgi:hypothetical protein
VPGWTPTGDDVVVALFGLSIVGLAFAGLGVLIHTAYRPSVHKLRMMLGAVASLVLTVASVDPIGRAAREVHASSAIVRMQPLADALARDGRIRSIGVSRGDWVELNGWAGSLDGGNVPVVDGRLVPLLEVLQRDGISRLDLVRLLRQMREQGVTRVHTGAAYVAFERRGGQTPLLYLRPGQPLPPPGTAILDRNAWHTQPMGGGWYLFLPGSGYR